MTADATRKDRRMTYDEFKGLLNTNTLIELLNGELRVNRNPDFAHQDIVGSIYMYLKLSPIVGTTVMSPTVVHLNNDTVVRPDVFWIKQESNDCVLGADGYWHGRPNLVVEVVSDDSEVADRGTKFDLYANIGIQEYWLVNPSVRFVEVYLRVHNTLARQGLFQPPQSFVSTALGRHEVDVRELFGRAN